MRFTPTVLALLPAIALTATPAAARTLTFQADLSGHYGSTQTGSPATAHATIKADMRHQRVSVRLDVAGLKTADLWDRLVAAPAGPIHFHQYPADGGDAVLALPLPYGKTYQATPKGFRVVMKGYDYTAGAKILGSGQSFADFVAALQRGKVILNVHTDRFEGGEISGQVTAAK